MSALIIFGNMLLAWWINSFWITYLDYKNCRINGFWFLFGQLINITTTFFIIETVVYAEQPLTRILLIVGFLLIIWFAHYIWVDYQASGTPLWLRLIYGTVDLATCLYICLSIYKNIFLVAGISEKFGKEAVVLALEKILKVGQTLVI